MAPRSRRRIEHARWVGLRSIPEPPPRRGTGRIAIVAGATLAVVLAGGALAAALSSGAPTPTPEPLGSTDPVAIATIAATSTPGPSATPQPTAPDPTALLAGYRWPLVIGRITTMFGPQPGGLFLVDGVPSHDGIDIASFCGDHVLAAHDGTVIASGRRVEDALGWVGDVAGYEAHLTEKHLWPSQAVMVITDDGNGYRSVYVHLFKSLVNVGQVLKAGDLIGYEGRTGDATGCHLHFSIFSPSDPDRFVTDPSKVEKSDLPAAEVARIDPLTVLPSIDTTEITWGWGTGPSASP